MAFNKDDAMAMFREADPTLTEEQIQKIAKATVSRISANHTAAAEMAKRAAQREVQCASDADRSEAIRLRLEAKEQSRRANALFDEARALQAKAHTVADHATVLAAAAAEDPRIGWADYYIRDAWQRAAKGKVTADQACRTTGMIVAAALGGLDMESLARAQKHVKDSARCTQESGGYDKAAERLGAKPPPATC